jgi:hypothetical protein
MKKPPAVLAFLPLFTLLLLTLSCQSNGNTRGNSPSYNNQMALRLLQRSKTQIVENDFAPAITDVVRAEEMCEDKGLLADIRLHREDILNHVLLQASVEEGDTLRYNLLYTRDEVFYPISNMNVRFSFVKGSGTMEEYTRTNASGTAISHIESLSSMRTKYFIESVAVVPVEDETVRIEELRYGFVVANRGDRDHVDVKMVTEIVFDAVQVSLDFLEILFSD